MTGKQISNNFNHKKSFEKNKGIGMDKKVTTPFHDIIFTNLQQKKRQK